ncbi:probable FBD-associated F-box protein At1g32375 [Lotus japonicus]|uniref:probable FBD-associated F-box protein At1g32375 n=1 Tax=Lotus japonicus TaxID=34305 RepID=UPI002582CCB9|nr:probable FBD-associated F-box protein At1g32375 [Lotus japonicus]
MADMDDRISRLSDELLCHILSFLPTQQAVATSVLSKRWLPLWISVPVLDYDNVSNREPSHSFERLIYATILARDRAQPITTFRLKYKPRVREHVKDVNVWVNTAIRRGIQNLEIKLVLEPETDSDTDFEADFDSETEDEVLPEIRLSCSRIFSCKTLVVLKLKAVSLAASFSFELPSLKSLHLSHVKFDKGQYLIEILYGCPMLEDLKTRNLDYGTGSICEKRFKILPKLARADMDFSWLETEDGNNLKIILKAISNVEFLTIDLIGVEVVDDVVPEFPHLRHLTLSGAYRNSHLTLLMLKNCPKLQSFKLCGSFGAKDVLTYPQFVPECLTSCLSKCYLERYQFTESDLKFAKYIMQNSTYLQVMKIGDASPNQSEVLKELLALIPRKSASCELSFI